MPCTLKWEQKEAIIHWFQDLLAELPTGIWKTLIFQVLVLMKEIMTGTFEHSCRLSASTYCLSSNGISIFDRISGSLYAYGFSFGGHRVRQMSTRICVTREHFGGVNFFLDEKKTI